METSSEQSELVDEHTEIPLPSGRNTTGVVRVGNTVRRPSKPSSPFMLDLLLHLESRGFTRTPRYLGVDEFGRDILSYIPGSIPVRFRRFADVQVHGAGALLRSFHDATRGSTLCGTKSVVCHNDAGPNNIVFRDDEPYALIDFDMAEPGEPIEDLGYMAWVWCVSSKPDRQPVDDQAAQLRILADGYGLDAADRRGLIEAVIDRQLRNVQFWIARKEEPSNAYTIKESAERIDEVISWSHRERRYVEANRAVFMIALG